MAPAENIQSHQDLHTGMVLLPVPTNKGARDSYDLVYVFAETLSGACVDLMSFVVHTLDCACFDMDT